MPENVSNNQIALKPSNEQIPLEPRSMDKAADRLMDDVFAEIDRTIETGSQPPVQTSEPEFISLQQISIPSINLPSPVLPSQVEEEDSSEADKNQKAQDEGKSLNKLLLGAAIASLAIMLLLWLAGQGRLNRLFGLQTASVPETPKGLSPVDSQFVDYMQRSLDLIDQKEESNEVASVPPSPVTALIPVPAPGNLPQPSNRPQSVLERVYIPVFPRPQVYSNPPKPTAAKPPASNPAQKATPSVIALPQIPAVNTAAPATRPTAKASPSPTVVALPQIPPVSTVAPTARSTAKPSPTVAATTRPRNNPSPTVAANTPAVAPSPTSRPQGTTQATAIQQTLVGVLVLGDKSAAIFEVNGTSRRINIGESIGSSGWTLVEVKNDEAVIRRNGEVRSVYVGQQF